MSPTCLPRTVHLPDSVRAAMAYAGGYFWLPCEVCGGHFAGFEWDDIDGLPSTVPDPDPDVGTCHGICPRCTAAGYGYPYGWKRA